MPRQPTVASYLLAGCGLLAVVVGTFLPWLQSGEVRRNSYAAFGLLRRLIGFDGLPAALTHGWPLLALCATAAVLAAVSGLHRIAVAVALVTVAWSATVSGAALAWQSTAGVSIVAIGPAVTLAGDAAVFVAAILTLISRVPGPAPSRSRR